MNNEYLLNDVLESEKNMTVNMATALNEASCTTIYDIYFKIFEELSKHTKTLFEIAYNNSWYTLTEEDNNKLCDEYNKLSKKLEDSF